MNYTLLVSVAIAGIIIGSYFGVKKENGGLIFGQTKKKKENKERILKNLRRLWRLVLVGW